MATTALPIRELSANVQFDAASAQKAFFEVVESKQQQAFSNLKIWYMTRRLGRRMRRLVVSQGSLIEYLRKIPVESVFVGDYSKVAGDLDRIVSMTNALLDDAYQLPVQCTSIWAEKLDKMADLNEYIGSFVESFRIAADGTCTALPADIAHRV